MTIRLLLDAALHDRSCLGPPADEVASMLADRMREGIAGAEQHDDMTFVVATVN